MREPRPTEHAMGPARSAVMHPLLGASITLQPDSILAQRTSAVIQGFDLTLLDSSPKIIELFKNRSMPRVTSDCAWEGEFVGKYLTHMVQLYRLTGDHRLLDTLHELVGLLAEYQAPDGYLGQSAKPWTPGVWDTWNHYHIVSALLLTLWL